MEGLEIPDIDHCTKDEKTPDIVDEYQGEKWSFHCQKRDVITISTTLDQYRIYVEYEFVDGVKNGR